MFIEKIIYYGDNVNPIKYSHFILHCEVYTVQVHNECQFSPFP